MNISPKALFFKNRDSLEWLLLQVMHYRPSYSPIPMSGLRPHGQQLYERELVARLSSSDADVRMQQDALAHLSEEGLVEKLGDNGWRPSPFGKHVAYNLCEYNIQKLSGFWDYASRFLPDREGIRVMDIGCGGGVSFLAAREAGLFRNAALFGVDVSGESIEAGRYLMDKWGADQTGITLIHADVGDVSSDLRGMDVVFSKSALQYIRADVFVQGLLKVLRPGGTFLVSMPGWQVMARNLKNALFRFDLRGMVKFSLAMVNTLLDMLGAGVYLHSPFRGGTRLGLRRTFGSRQIEVEHIGLNPVSFGAEPLVVIGRKSG